MLGLKTQKRKLSEQQRCAHDAMLTLLEEARRGLRDKSRAQASFCLKRKKLVEKRLVGIDELMVTVEDQLLTLEQAKRQSAVVGALRAGTTALKDIQSKTSLEDIEKLLEETDAARLTQKAINSKVYFECGDVGQELKMELEELEQLVADEEHLTLPAVPVTHPGVAEPWEVNTGGAQGAEGGGGEEEEEEEEEERERVAVLA